MVNRLIKKLEEGGKNHLSDEFLAMAFTVETSLIDAGAVPGKDYSVLDLFKLAQPFALELFKLKPMEYDYAHRRTL